MEKYLIFKKTSETNREYVYYIQRNSASTSSDLGDAIEFDSKELALMIAKYLTNRTNDNKKYYVLSMVTKIDVLEEE